MTSLELEALSNAVIPAKAGIHELSYGLSGRGRPQKYEHITNEIVIGTVDSTVKDCDKD